LKESISIFNLLQKSTIGISVVGFLIGLISMLHNLTEPSSVGPSMAVALIIVFYSTILCLVILSPAKYILSKIERRINNNT
jgi:chemotaxis protein MotA